MWKLAILLTILSNKVVAGRLITCYYRNWVQYGKEKAKFLPENIDPSLCSVIKYAFMRVNHETNELETTQDNDGEMLARINALKMINPSLQIFIAVGGWNHEYKARYSKMARTSKTRKTFIYSVIEFLREHNLDGLSFDWLYPGIRPKHSSADDKKKFSRLLKETLAAFEEDALQRNTKRFHLSATVSSSVKKIHKCYEILKVAKYVDSVDVMVNSLWGYWKRRTGSATAMKGNTPTVIDSIEAWLNAGMPARKLNIGFALYGRTFKLRSASNYEVGAPTIGPGKAGNHTQKEGILAYYEICSRKWTHKTEWYDSKTEAAYASDGNLWVGYDNPASLKYKIDRLFQKYNLNGITLWALDYDDFTGGFCNAGKYPLIREIKMAINTAPVSAVASCKAVVDVGFILDSSGSLRDDYQNEKNFLKNLAGKIGVSKNGSRAGVITFSHSPEHSIKLNDYFDILAFNAAVDYIPLMGYTTRIDRALRLTQVSMFTVQNGARPGIPKFLILLTDGTQTKYNDAEDLSDIGEELRKSGITIFTIGIGRGIDTTELVKIAGATDKSFNAASFTELTGVEFVKDIGDAVCSAAVMTPVITCKTAFDVGFILDSSGSLRNDYSNEKYFLKAIASSFGISKDGTRAGVITFSYFALNSIKLNDHFDTFSFNEAVDAIPLMGYTTRIDKALRLVQRVMFTLKNGARDGVPDLLVFLTDGSQTTGVDTEHPGDIANELRDAGVHILVVGIGSGTNLTELEHIAGDVKYMFIAPSFKKLIQSDFITKVKKNSCPVSSKRLMKTTPPVSTMIPMMDTIQPKPKCKMIADIGFILDSSGSLRNDYEKEKEFLKELAAYFGLSKDGSHAAVITFSYTPKHSIKLNEHFDLNSFNDAVDRIQLMGYTTRIDRALRLTQLSMFTEENGGRTGRYKILILLTDGTQTKDAGAEDPGDVAAELRNSGINIFSVGIGSGIDDKELAHIAGGSDKTFIIASFNDLMDTDLVERMGKTICPDAPIAPIQYNTCKVIVDLGFILDSSGSLRNDYDKEKYFLKSISSSFGISKDGSRAGVVTFSYSAIHSIKLNEHIDTISFNAAVDAIPFMGYTTRIDKALRLTQKAMFKLKNGARPDVRKLLVLLTDGSQTSAVDAEHPASIAEELRNSGIDMVVVGIGKGVNSSELALIAGDKNNMFIAPSFSDLIGKEFMYKLRNATCDRKNPIEEVTVTAAPTAVSSNDVESILATSAISSPKCQTTLDVGFILDSSGSLRDDYNREKYFLNTLAASSGVSKDNSRAGVITFSFFAEHSIKLNDHADINSFSAAVNAIPLMGYTSMIDRALRLAQSEMFTVKNGARYGVPKILILLTDGSQSKHRDAEDPVIVAQEIREAGIKIFVIGIGKGINRDELVNIAGSEEDTFIASSFDMLVGKEFIKMLKNITCVPGISADQVLPFNQISMAGGLVSSNSSDVPSQKTEDNVGSKGTTGMKMICPLDKDISVMQVMIKSGINATFVAKFFHESEILKKMLKYYGSLKSLMMYLSTNIPTFKTKIITDVNALLSTSINTCKTFEIEAVLSRVFGEERGDDLFTATRKHSGEFFIDLLWTSGIASDILKSGGYVFIVPIDQSFKKLPKLMRKKLMDKSFLKRVLQFHISKIDNSKTSIHLDSKSMVSLDEGKRIFFNELNGVKTFSGSIVLKQKILARNGAIWIVDSLMLPPEKSIASIVAAANHLSILKRALNDTLLSKELKSLESYTILGPSDEAFENHSNLKHDILTDPDTLRSLIRGHIIIGTFFTTIFDYSISYTLRTLDNSNVFVQKIDDILIINHGVTVKNSNIHGTDGVLHVIDDVIFFNSIK